MVWAAALGFLAMVAGQAWAGDKVVARLDDWSITEAELDKMVQSKIHEAKMKLFQIRLEKLSGLLAERLLAKEAKLVGVSVDALLQKEVYDKVTPPSDDQVQKFIQANRKRLPNGGIGLEGDVKRFMTEGAKEDGRAMFVRMLSVKHKANVSMKPPKPPLYQVRGPNDVSKGNPNAKVTVVEFSDFECPYCRKAQATLKQVEEAYGDQVKMVFRHYPMAFHKLAPKASEASMCAREQKKFWPYHDLLFEAGADLTPSGLKKSAEAMKLDMAAFNSCLDSDRYAERLEKDMAEGVRLGVSGTPTFFINGVKLVGAQPFSRFKAVIDEALAN